METGRRRSTSPDWLTLGRRPVWSGASVLLAVADEVDKFERAEAG